MEKAATSIIGEYLEGYKIVRVQQIRPQFYDLHFDNDQQKGILMNTLTSDRFEHLRCTIGEDRVEGSCLISKLGLACIDRQHLEHSLSSNDLSLKDDQIGGCLQIESRYSSIKRHSDGSIHSWKDKRTKNFHRELCKPGDRLNKLSIHEDVPFFWDAWDVMLHSFETVKEYKATHHEVIEQTGSRIRVKFHYKLHSGVSTIQQIVCFYSDTARVDF